METPESPPVTQQIALFNVEEPPNAYRKAVQVLHSKPSEPLSLLQGKLSNCWLKNALDTDPDHEGWWSISISKMATEIGFDSNNRDYLRNSSLELMKIVFEYDVISNRNNRVQWKASVLFPDIEIADGVIRYQISSQLRERVLNPDMYALVDLNVLRRFQRSSSIPIYEHCVRFVNLGKTADVDLDTFRDIVLGSKSSNSSYKEYKYFKQKVLRPTIAEINTFSEITIELIEGFAGRRVNSIQFYVKRKSPSEILISTPEEIEKITSDLTDFGLPAPEIKRLVKTHTFHELNSALEYTRKRQADKRSSLTNPIAYFKTTLQNRWGIIDLPIKTKPPKPTPDHGPGLNGIDTVDHNEVLDQLARAEQYFENLDTSRQQLHIATYNAQQSIKTLQVKTGKKSKATASAFYRWLVTEIATKPDVFSQV